MSKPSDTNEAPTPQRGTTSSGFNDSISLASGLGNS